MKKLNKDELIKNLEDFMYPGYKTGAKKIVESLSILKQSDFNVIKSRYESFGEKGYGTFTCYKSVAFMIETLLCEFRYDIDGIVHFIKSYPFSSIIVSENGEAIEYIYKQNI